MQAGTATLQVLVGALQVEHVECPVVVDDTVLNEPTAPAL